FQAEDGIRDLYVTGVQTCALPICRTSPDPPLNRRVRASLGNTRRFSGGSGDVRRLLLRPRRSDRALGGLCVRAPRRGLGRPGAQIGRASCRERGWGLVVAVSVEGR